MSKSQLGLIASITFVALTGYGCSYLFAGAAIATDNAVQGEESTPYEDAPPEAATTDADFENKLVEWSQEHEYKFDVRWTIIGEDWMADRQQDAAGNENVVGRQRLVWMGGPVTTPIDEYGAEQGDCIYFLISGYQENMGGGEYGPTRFSHANEWKPNVHKLRCEDEEELATAAPEGQEPGALVGEAKAEETEKAEAEEADDGADSDAADNTD